MIKIVNMIDFEGGIDAAIQFYHHQWGSDWNYAFFEDAIRHSTNGDEGLPRFYVMVKGNEIIGCCGLIVNDFISRHDLMPWFCGLYVVEVERGKRLGNELMKHGAEEAKRIGYNAMYLATDLDGYYERYGWHRIEDGYFLWGMKARIYKCEC